MATVPSRGKAAPKVSFDRQSRKSRPANRRRRQPKPAGIHPHRVLWNYALSIAAIHLLALLAFVPWLFSWTGIAVWLGGQYLFGVVGITLGYHRLLTHRGFKCPRWFEYGVALLGVCSLQDTPSRWVALHRRHHQHSDTQPDPHSPLASFLWSHVGWLLVANRETDTADFLDRYARDLLRQPFYLWFERKLRWLWVYLAHAAVYFALGMAAGWLMFGEFWPMLQLALSVLVWGVFVRTVTVWHVTWSVNSISHLWGYRSHDTDDESRNNWLVGIVAAGEGWHNNHHAQQQAAAHGQQWWEIDVTYWTIRLLESVGLVSDVIRPKPKPAS